MNVRTPLKLACILSLFAVGACDVDPEVAESDLELAAVEDDEDAEAPAEATRPSLDFSAPADDGLAAGCFTGQKRTKTTPSGICGGCLINGSYPGQKLIHEESHCMNNGVWSLWKNTGTSCEDC